jgi:hypothetical protein
MAELKTKKNESNVDDFLQGVADEIKRNDCFTVLEMMARITGRPAKMYGTSMVGFGSYKYTYASGHSGQWFLSGFAPRKQNLVIYIMSGFSNEAELMARLGKYKTGKSCLYLKRLADIDLAVLEDLIRNSVDYMSAKYDCE